VIRAVASAAILGVLILAGVNFAGRDLVGQDDGKGRPGLVAAAAYPEDWPICTAMTAMGTEADWAQLDPDFAAGKRALVIEDWKGAIAAFKLAVLRDPRNADIQNYIGYAYRRLRDMGPAMGHYQQALMFNPRHRGAREHLGELYLVLGEPIKAEEQLATLREICLVPCDEVADLERAIAGYRAMAVRPGLSTAAF
jgi:tetratricopeptide (TPR) repeat protein